VGGPAVDLHVHDAHFILSVFGKPNSLVSQGRMRGEVAEYFTTLFRFADPKLAVSATSGVVNQQGRPFTHGFEIHLERATLLFDFAVMSDGQNQARKLTLLNDQGGVEYPELPAGDPMLAAFVAEVAEVARCVQGGKPSQLLGGELARDAIALCHLQQTAVQLAQPQEFA
jgi:predicted dehydrogenase